MKAQILLSLTSIILLSSFNAVAQDAVESQEAAPVSRIPYSITVTPNPSRARLRKLIDTVEDDFVERFNELNLDDDYDIHCSKVTRTLSHIRKRICEAEFLIKARADNVSEYMLLGGFLLSPSALEDETFRDFEILQEKVDELTSTHKSLRDVAYVLGELKSRLKNYGKE